MASSLQKNKNGYPAARFASLVGLCLCAIFVWGCGGGGGSGSGSGSGSNPPSSTLARLEVTAPTTTLTAIDDTVQLSAAGLDAQGVVVSLGPVQWSSAATAVAQVSATGLVTAKANGVTTITAASGAISGTIQVTIAQAVATVAVSGPGALRAIGAQADLSAAVKDRNGHSIATTVLWTSSDPSVIGVDGNGRITAAGVGSATIQGVAGSVSDSMSIEVATVRRVPVDSYLATPAAGAVWDVPVLLLAYVPTADGVNLDVTQSPDFYSLNPRTIAAVETDILDFARRTKMAREEGSRFRAYKNTSALPSLGFRVVEHIVVYTQLPGVSQMYGGAHLVDYHKMFRDLDLERLITEHGVKEIWLAVSSFDAGYPSYNPAIHDIADTRFVFESNMASPTTGDVSNSNRDPNDLPVLGHTYTVYGTNFRRSQAEAVHNVGHQLEAMFAHVNQRAEGNTDLFWKKFVGQDASGAFTGGRAGWTHMPPNTTQNYEYLSPTLVQSDIEDWRADGTGVKKAVNVDTWGTLTFPWPGAMDFPQRVETQWYIYWFQSMPGLDNHIPLRNGEMTNWWRFVADWDAAINANAGLATVRDSETVVIRNDFLGSVFLDPGGNVAAGASISLPAPAPIVVRVHDCGDPAGAGGCIMDPYTLEPGSYRVIQHPSGPPNNLTIVQQ